MREQMLLLAQMIKMIIILILVALGCQEKPDNRKRDLTLLALFASRNVPTIQNCRAYSGNGNSLYPNYLVTQQDNKTYTTVILGDSTMDLSGQVQGFLSTGTQNRAVSGNTLCDMLEQSYDIRYKPDRIVVASLGGNDLLRHVSNANIIQTGKDLVSRLRQVYPSALIYGVGVHQTKVDYANANRGITNAALQPLFDCYLNPDPYFTSPSSDYVDSIHYSSTVSMKIRQGLIDNCKVTLSVRSSR